MDYCPFVIFLAAAHCLSSVGSFAGPASVVGATDMVWRRG